MTKAFALLLLLCAIACRSDNSGPEQLGSSGSAGSGGDAGVAGGQSGGGRTDAGSDASAGADTSGAGGRAGASGTGGGAGAAATGAGGEAAAGAGGEAGNAGDPSCDAVAPVTVVSEDPSIERFDLSLTGAGFDAEEGAALNLRISGGGYCGLGLTTIQCGRFAFDAPSSLGYTWYVALVLYIDDNESGECDDEDRVWSLVTPGVTENLRFEIAPSDSEWGAGNGDCYAAIGPCGP